MDVIEHGDWQVYKPASLPQGVPANAMFASRASDGVDWYPYAHDSANFTVNTVKMTVINNVVATATTDPTMLFPGGTTVLEVTDVPLDDLHDTWSHKIYDPVTKTFSDPPPEAVATTDFEARLAALEAKSGGA